jgi:hypothetical protein
MHFKMDLKTHLIQCFFRFTFRFVERDRTVNVLFCKRFGP